MVEKQLKYQKNMKNVKSFKLFENPDYIENKKSRDLFKKGLIHSDYDTITFGYYNGEMLLGRFHMTHSDLDGNVSIGRTEFEYPGRLWIDSKVISFWLYPPKEELYDIIKDIEITYNNDNFSSFIMFNIDDKCFSTMNGMIKFNYEIIDDKIIINHDEDKFELTYNENIPITHPKDIILSLKNNDINRIKELGLHYVNYVNIKAINNKLKIGDDWWIEIRTNIDNNWFRQNPIWESNDVEYIKLKDYCGSFNTSEEEMGKAHLDWKLKAELKKKGWGKGFGSDMTAWDSKNPLAWRQAKYQESKKIEAADSLIHNNLYLNYKTFPFGNLNNNEEPKFCFNSEGKTHNSFEKENDLKDRMKIKRENDLKGRIKGKKVKLKKDTEVKTINMLSYAEKQELKKKDWGHGWGSDLTWDGKNPLWWKQLKYQENMKNVKSFKLFENPDYMENKKSRELFKKDLIYSDYDTITFGYYNDKMLLGRFNITHSNLYSNRSIDRIEFKYPGRLWIDSKVISFWLYPTKEELYDIIKDIEITYNNGNFLSVIMFDIDDKCFSTMGRRIKFNYEIIDDKIIIIHNEDKFELIYNENISMIHPKDVILSLKNNDIDRIKELELHHTKYVNIKALNNKLKIGDDWWIEIRTNMNNNWQYAFWEDNDVEYIKLRDYYGSLNASEEEMGKAHLDWRLKAELKKKGWGKGFGSDLTAWDSKNPLAWRHAKYQENKQQKF